MKNTRLNYIDYGKFLFALIVCVVHSGYQTMSPQIQGMIIPFFFFIAGYNFDPEKRTYKEYVSSRFYSVVIPFWLLMLLYIPINLFREHFFSLPIHPWHTAGGAVVSMIYGSFIVPPLFLDFLEKYCFFTPEVMAGTADFFPNAGTQLWFLPVLFTACVIFYPIAKKLSRNFTLTKLVAISFVFICLSYAEIIFPAIYQLPWGLGRAFLGVTTMIFGFYFRTAGDFVSLTKKQIATIGLSAIALFILACVTQSGGNLIIQSYFGPHGFPNLVINWISGTAGAFFIIIIFKKIDDLRNGAEIKPFAWFGRNLMWIYGLHHVFFTLFEFIFYALGYEMKPDQWNYIIYQYDLHTLPLHIIQVATTVFACALIGSAYRKYKK